MLYFIAVVYNICLNIVLGPTIHTNFKRLYQEDTESDSDEEGVKREGRKRKLLPRKLFKADSSTCKGQLELLFEMV